MKKYHKYHNAIFTPKDKRYIKCLVIWREASGRQRRGYYWSEYGEYDFDYIGERDVDVENGFMLGVRNSHSGYTPTFSKEFTLKQYFES